MALRWLVLLLLWPALVCAQLATPMSTPGDFSTVVLSNPVNWQSPLNRGLVSWWLNLPSLSGGGTTFRDIAGSNHGTLTSMATPSTSTSGWNRTTRRGGWGHLAFDGTNDYVGVPSSTQFDFAGDFSVSAWIYATASTAFVDAVSRATSSLAQQWALEQISGSRIDFYLQTSGGTYRAQNTTKWSVNMWHFVVGTLTGTTVRVYVDGVVGGTTATITGSFSSLPGTKVAMGAAGQNPANYWPGAIDDVRLYNRTLSALEVLALYQGSLQGYPQTLNRIQLVGNAPVAAAGGTGNMLPFFTTRLLPTLRVANDYEHHYLRASGE